MIALHAYLSSVSKFTVQSAQTIVLERLDSRLVSACCPANDTVPA